MSLDWPILSVDLRWPLMALVPIFLSLWILSSVGLYLRLRRDPAIATWVLPKYKTWYVWAQIIFLPFFRVINYANGGVLPNWLVAIGKRVPIDEAKGES